MPFWCLKFVPKNKRKHVICFLEEFTAWQFAFEINWPLVTILKALHPAPLTSQCIRYDSVGGSPVVLCTRSWTFSHNIIWKWKFPSLKNSYHSFEQTFLFGFIFRQFYHTNWKKNPCEQPTFRLHLKLLAKCNLEKAPVLGYPVSLLIAKTAPLCLSRDPGDHALWHPEA